MELTILEILYIVLIVFTSIIWTLLIITLFRVLKVLKAITEVVDFYNKIKQILNIYAHIPEIIISSIKEVLSSKDEKNTKKD